MTPLLGLRVKFDGYGGCCGNIATVSRTVGPHYAELHCAACGSHRGWLSKFTASWITTVINKFGAPDAPIVIRRGLVHPPNTSATADTKPRTEPKGGQHGHSF